MTVRQLFMRLVLFAALLISVGCATRGARSTIAKTGDQILPTHSPGQLLAAARQYEKEGRPDLATRYYRQVLALDPQNVEAHNGLDLVQSGNLRTQAGYQEIVSAAQPSSRPRLRDPNEPSPRYSEIDEKTAQMIANAAATATAQAISEAVAKATVKYMEETPVPVQSRQLERRPSPITLAASETTSPSQAAVPPAKQAADAKSSIDEAAVVSVQVVSSDESVVVSSQAETTSADNPDCTEAASTDSAPVATTTQSSDRRHDAHVVQGAWSDDSQWQSPKLTRLCHDANAAVLREVAKLDSQEPAVKKDGLRALAHLGPDASSAMLAVRMLFHDDDELVRAHAAWAAWEITGDAGLIVPLTNLLSSEEARVVEFAAYTLAGIGEPARPALPVLRQLRESDDLYVRLHAAETISRIATPAEREDATERLIMMTAESNSEIRMLAVLALGTTATEPTPQVTTALSSALYDSDAEVRAAAALTLGGFGPAARSAIAQLEFVAEGDREDVKQAAATALECIRHPN